MIAVPAISLKKLVAPALLIAVLAVSSIGFAPKAGAVGSSAGYWYVNRCFNQNGTSNMNYFVTQNKYAANKSYGPNNFCLVSSSGRYMAVFQTDGNFVLYDISNGSPLWASGTNGRGATRLTFQTDGNIVIYRDYAGGYQVLWATNTWGIYNSTGRNNLIMQSDGNLVIYQGDIGYLGRALWATGTNR